MLSIFLSIFFKVLFIYLYLYWGSTYLRFFDFIDNIAIIVQHLKGRKLITLSVHKQNMCLQPTVCLDKGN